MRKLFLLCLLLLVFTVPALAQDTAAWEYPTIDLTAVGALIVNTVSGIVLGAFGGAPIVVLVVAALKRLPALDGFSAKGLSFATAAVLYIVAVIASVTGYEVQFRSFLEMVTVAAPAVVAFLSTLLGAPQIYKAAKKADAPVVGQPREPEIAPDNVADIIMRKITDAAKLPTFEVNSFSSRSTKPE